MDDLGVIAGVITIFIKHADIKHRTRDVAVILCMQNIRNIRKC